MTSHNVTPQSEKAKLPVHPDALRFPVLKDEEYQSLKRSIADEGLIDPIALYNDQLLDGRHRYRACLELGIEPRFDVLPLTTDTLRYVIAKNVVGRQLTTSQRGLMAAEMVDWNAWGAPPGGRGNQHSKRQQDISGKSRNHDLPEKDCSFLTREEAAELYGVSKSTIDTAHDLLVYCPAELIQEVRDGEKRLGAMKDKIRDLKLEAAVKIGQSNIPPAEAVEHHRQGLEADEIVSVGRLPEAQRRPAVEVITKVRAETGKRIDTPDAVKLARLPAARQERVIQFANEAAVDVDARLDTKSAAYAERRKNRYEVHFAPGRLPDGQYEIILADPPWKYPEGGVQMDYEAREWYKPMELDEIKAMGVELEGIIAEDAALYLWTTSTHLEGALAVMKDWGFEYHSLWAWDKERSGLGPRCLHQMEYLLLCTRGSFPPPPEGTLRINLFRGNTGKHSKKPVALYEMIEEQYPRATKLELFARQARAGWDTWGNEAE